MAGSDALGILAGVALDALIGDPRRAHPVAAFGRAAKWLEKLIYRDSRQSGLVHTAVCLLAATSLGLWAKTKTRDRPLARTAVTAAATWAVLGGTTLAREAGHMAHALDRGDLDAARDRLPHLCGRDPSGLATEGLARATIESVAENTSDAVVAPLFWGAVLGVPGLLGYRAINTLDAMVGYRSPRYASFGWAAARLDDAANLIPARLTGVLAAVFAPTVGGETRQAAAVLQRYGHRHPSPNAGRCEAAFAGALGVRLGGGNVYHGRREERPELGDGRRPTPEDIHRSVRLARVVGLAALGLATALSACR